MKYLDLQVEFMNLPEDTDLDEVREKVWEVVSTAYPDVSLNITEQDRDEDREE